MEQHIKAVHTKLEGRHRVAKDIELVSWPWRCLLLLSRLLTSCNGWQVLKKTEAGLGVHRGLVAKIQEAAALGVRLLAAALVPQTA